MLSAQIPELFFRGDPYIIASDIVRHELDIAMDGRRHR
jgi:hypothetical protein